MRLRPAALPAWLAALAWLTGPVPAPAGDLDLGRLRTAALAGDFASIRPLGPGALPALVELYSSSSDPRQRATIAYVLYNLGWKSEPAMRALLADVHTPDTTLRLQVQWALGRVSDDPSVVDVLLDNMRNDPVPLFRDKAACALAHDQVHLAPAQKRRLFAGLIDALGADEPQVRQIAIQALQALTGQTKGFGAGADPAARQRATAEWRRWLADYSASQ